MDLSNVVNNCQHASNLLDLIDSKVKNSDTDLVRSISALTSTLQSLSGAIELYEDFIKSEFTELPNNIRINKSEVVSVSSVNSDITIAFQNGYSTTFTKEQVGMSHNLFVERYLVKDNSDEQNIFNKEWMIIGFAFSMSRLGAKGFSTDNIQKIKKALSEVERKIKIYNNAINPFVAFLCDTLSESKEDYIHVNINKIIVLNPVTLSDRSISLDCIVSGERELSWNFLYEDKASLEETLNHFDEVKVNTGL